MSRAISQGTLDSAGLDPTANGRSARADVQTVNLGFSPGDFKRPGKAARGRFGLVDALC